MTKIGVEIDRILIINDVKKSGTNNPEFKEYVRICFMKYVNFVFCT